ncbi:MAG: OB-fold nucleic acid binding domain-containing protein, partial [Planctomycetota bacterium]|nr:OB-fold nucleic acid binding domain-containing protein [Planctomycetota bacterium]MDI6788567.1 OB-fold nucleic acid binding domain-containing protein [Planctomycetota bacterium]
RHPDPAPILSGSGRGDPPLAGKTHRNQLLKGIEQIVLISNQHQLDRKQGQLSILTSTSKGGGGEINYPLLPDEPELSEEDLLRYEKESLGFYVSGHPLVKYEKILKELSPLSIGELVQNTSTLDEIKICGIISQIETKAIKGSKEGKKIVLFKLRDLSGVIEAVVYPEEMHRFRHLIRDNEIVCVKARYDLRKGEPSLRVKNMASITNAYEIMPNCVAIEISLTGLDDNVIYGLKDILLAHPGSCQVFLRLKNIDKETALVKLSNNFSVSISPRFREDITDLIGQDVIRFNI